MKHWRRKEIKYFLKIICSYNQCIQLDYKYVNAWNGKGNALKNLERFEEALEA